MPAGSTGGRGPQPLPAVPAATPARPAPQAPPAGAVPAQAAYGNAAVARTTGNGTPGTGPAAASQTTHGNAATSTAAAATGKAPTGRTTALPDRAVFEVATPGAEAGGNAARDLLAALPPSRHKAATSGQAQVVSGLAGVAGTEMQASNVAIVPSGAGPAAAPAPAGPGAGPAPGNVPANDQDASESPPAAAPASDTSGPDAVVTEEPAAYDTHLELPPPAGGTVADEESQASADPREARLRLDAVTTSSDVSIDPPPVPQVQLTGDADPAQADTDRERFDAETEAAQAAADAEVLADRGEDAVESGNVPGPQDADPSTLSTEPEQDSNQIYQTAVAEAGLGPDQYPFTENVDVVATLLEQHEQQMSAEYDASMAQYHDGVAEERRNLDEQVQQAVGEAGQREQQARADLHRQVDEARDSWQAENTAAADDARAQADEAGEQAHAQIDDQLASFDQQAQAATDQAVADAQRERDTAERRAREERDAAEKAGDEGGFWDWVGDALDSVISALTSVLSTIFNALRWAVNKIFQGLEWVVGKLVRLVQWVVVGILRALRWTLQYLRQGLVALFGENAGRWIDRINGFLDDAIKVLDAIFDWFREALVGILEMVNQGLQALLKLVQWGLALLILLSTGLFLRYIWIAIENFDRIVKNVRASVDGLGAELGQRLGPDWRQFVDGLLQPASIAMLVAGLIVFVVSQFVGVGEVIDIILLILAVLYLGTVAVHLGEQVIAYVTAIFHDDVDGARRILADTIWWFLFNAPLVILAVLGVRGGLRELGAPRAAGEGAPGAVPEGEGAPRMQGEGEGTAGRSGESEPVPAEESGCFVAGTRIQGVDGPVAIEVVNVGTRVFALAVEAGHEQTIATVVRRIERSVPVVLDLCIGGETLTCSPEHPFWVPGSGWRTAGSLSAGTALLARGGGHPTIDAITRRTGRFTVYNIEVESPHDYFVGHAGLLVHNKPMRWFLADRMAAIEARVADLVARAEALPENAHGRAQLIEQARALEGPAAELGRAAAESPQEAALEPQRAALDELEDSAGNLESQLEAAELPAQLPALETEAVKLGERAKELPEPARGNALRELDSIRKQIRALRELLEEGTDPSLVEEYWALRRMMAELEGEVAANEPAPAAEGGSASPRPHLRHPASELPTRGKHPYQAEDLAGSPEITRPTGRAGFSDRYGNIWEWARDPHGGPHWDVQHPDGTHTNVFPDGNILGPDNF